MIPEAARMRRWMLKGMPLMLCCALFMHAGGGAAGMLLWLIGGCLHLPPIAYPYPRKRHTRPYRVFFAWSIFSLGLFLAKALLFLIYSGSPGVLIRLFYYGGAVGLLLPLSGIFLSHPKNRPLCQGLSGLCWLLILFIVYRG